MTNFNNIIKEYCIQIPIIQRDYAQGRGVDEISDIRNIFLETILSNLLQEKTLHLDFVYGSIKPQTDKTVFVPLDGQQRLTTLFLLHWYLGKKENKDIQFLSNFTYETRSSSREFCNKLIQAKIDFTSSNLIEQIKDSSWFMPFWDNDPTIKSMFRMIQDIHKMFNEYDLFEKLNLITFEFFELEKFGLDDDLYIKMNARGKPLTKFENFKATFEQLLNKVDIELEQQFARKIDNEWTNNFWSYKDKNFLIDSAFMNYFYFISEMLYIKEQKVEKELQVLELKSLIPTIYSTKSNITFLFGALDSIEKINSIMNDVFSSYFEINKVALFDANTNLLEKIIKSEKGNLINLQQKILLYVIINECVTLNDELNIDILRDKLRVARNLTERIRSLKQSQLTYTATLKYENLHQIIKSLLSINTRVYDYLISNTFEISGTQITKLSLEQEIKKAKILSENPDLKQDIERFEDYHYIRGDLSNFLIENIDDFKYACHKIPQIFENSDDLISRSLLTINDYKLWRGWSGGSSKFFFGKKGYWDIILTATNKDYSNIDKEFFVQYLKKYKNSNEDLQTMIQGYISNETVKNWKYYFIKYDAFLSRDNKLSQDNNLFAWYDDYSLEKMGGTNLNAFHFNPYLKAVAVMANINYSPYKWDGYSKLQVHSKMTEFYCEKNGWTITFSPSLEDEKIQLLVKDFDLKQNILKKYILVHIEGEDIIEKARDFINALKQL